MNISFPHRASKIAVAVCIAAGFFGSVAGLRAQQPPELPAPQKEHKWLEQFVGEWESEVEIAAQPGEPPMKLKGTEKAKLLGGFWMVSEGRGDMFGAPFLHMLTLGYDVEKKKYIGTWIDSMQGYLWKYEGTVDATGKILTLETEGPSPFDPAKKAKFREVTEFKSKDHRVFTSAVQADDGKWNTIITVNTRRKP